MTSIEINDRIFILGKKITGTVVFKGKTEFSSGLWFGIILDEPKGRNNGSYEGVRYFNCPRNYGIFVRECQLQKIDETECSQHTQSPSRDCLPKVIYPNYLRKRSSKCKCDQYHAVCMVGDKNISSSLTPEKDNVLDEYSVDRSTPSSSSSMKHEKKVTNTSSSTGKEEEITTTSNTSKVEERKEVRGELENEINVTRGNHSPRTSSVSTVDDSEDFSTLLQKAIEEKRISDIKILIQREEKTLIETEEYIKNFKKKFSTEKE